MSVSISTIKRLLIILIGVLVITYLFSLNMENHFFEFNTRWLSNDFLFAISGGAFASLLIVLVCEVIKYRQQKLMTEHALLANLESLYGQFLIIRSNCMRSLNGHDIVPDNLIQPVCNSATMIVDYINGIDYTTFCKRNKVREILTQFKTDKFLTLKNVLYSFTFLNISIKEDAINLLFQGKQKNVTSDCPYTKETLNKVINQTATILTYLDQITSQIDNELDNRYHWQNVKNSLNAYQDNFVRQTLEDYLKENIVVF